MNPGGFRTAVQSLSCYPFGCAPFVACALALLLLTFFSARPVAAEDSRQCWTTEKRLKLAVSRQLAAQSELKLDEHYDLALLLAVEAHRIEPTSASIAALLKALEHYPRLHSFLHVRRFLREEVPDPPHFSPDRRFMVVREDKDSLAVWDIDKRKMIHRFVVPDGLFALVSVGPGAELVATLGRGEGLSIWNVKTGDKVSTVPYTPWEMGSEWEFEGEFSRDGRLFAARGPDGILVWDIEKNVERAVIGADPEGRALAFSPDSRIIAYDDAKRGEIVLWELSPGRKLKALGGAKDRYWHLEFDSSGNYLAAAGSRVTLWSLREPRPGWEVRFSEPSDYWRSSVAFHPERELLAVMGPENDKVTLTFANKRSELPFRGPIATWTRHTLWWKSNICFSNDEKYLVTEGDNDKFIFWDVSSEGERKTFEPQVLLNVHALAFVPNDRSMILAGADGKIVIREGDVSKEVGSNPDGSQRIQRLLVSHDGKYVAAVTAGDEPQRRGVTSLFVLDRESGNLVGRYVYPAQHHQDRLLDLAFTAQNDLVVLLQGREQKSSRSAVHFCRLLQWSSKSGKWTLRKILDGAPSDFAATLSSDGIYIAETARRGDRITLRTVAAPEEVLRVFQKSSQETESLIFSPGGSTLACATVGESVRQTGSVIWLQMWETATGKEVSPPIPVAPCWNVRLALAPNGKVMAQAGQVGAHSELQLWGLPAWFSIGRSFDWDSPDSEDYTIRTVADVFFSPDGKKLAAKVERSEEGSKSPKFDMYLWNMDLDSWKAEACRIANRNLSRAEWMQYLGDVPYCKTCPGLPNGEGVASDARR